MSNGDIIFYINRPKEGKTLKIVVSLKKILNVYYSVYFFVMISCNFLREILKLQLVYLWTDYSTKLNYHRHGTNLLPNRKSYRYLFLFSLFYILIELINFHVFLNQCIDENTDIVYQATSAQGGGIIGARDFVILRHRIQYGNYYINSGTSVPFTSLPNRNNVVR